MLQLNVSRDNQYLLGVQVKNLHLAQHRPVEHPHKITKENTSKISVKRSRGMCNQEDLSESEHFQNCSSCGGSGQGQHESCFLSYPVISWVSLTWERRGSRMHWGKKKAQQRWCDADLREVLGSAIQEDSSKSTTLLSPDGCNSFNRIIHSDPISIQQNICSGFGEVVRPENIRDIRAWWVAPADPRNSSSSSSQARTRRKSFLMSHGWLLGFLVPAPA